MVINRRRRLGINCLRRVVIIDPKPLHEQELSPALFKDVVVGLLLFHASSNFQSNDWQEKSIRGKQNPISQQAQTLCTGTS